MSKALVKEQWKDRVVGFVRRPAKDFQANALNFRRHPNTQRDAFRGLISELGFAGAVLENTRTGNLIDGHLRIEEALSIDDAMLIPCVQVDLSEAEEKLLLASYDPISAMATADKETLDLLLKDVSASDVAVEAMLQKLAEDNGLSFGAKEEDESKVGELIDRAAELQEKWRVETGSLYAISGHRLLCGDSTDPEAVKTLMGGKEAALCFTSPPYGQQRAYTQQIADWDALMRGVFGNMPLTDDGQIIVNLGLVHRDGEWIDYWVGWVEWMRAQGWRKFGWYVWDQGHGLMGDWNGRFAPSHEFLFHFNRKSKQPHKTVPTKPSSLARAESKRKGAAEGKKQQGLRNMDGSISEISSLDKCGQLFKVPDSVVRIVREQARGIHTEGHPAVFPDELPAFVMEAYTSKSDVCYEPFNGSGSSIVAAEGLERICYGMEIEPKYCAVTLERMTNLGLEARLTPCK